MRIKRVLKLLAFCIVPVGMAITLPPVAALGLSVLWGLLFTYVFGAVWEE